MGAACPAIVLAVLMVVGSSLAGDMFTNAFSARVVVSTNFYTVTGSTLAELNASKVQSRPWRTNGIHDGLTAWNLEWNYRSGGEPGQVRLAAFTCVNKVVVTLPRWTPPAGADPSLVRGWDRFSNNLGLHEDGHVMLARHGTAELYRKVKALGSFGSTRELETELRRIADAAIASLRQREAEYDRRTHHGAGGW